MSRLGDLGHRLYSGELSYDIVGRRRRWYLVSGVLILMSVLSLGFRQLSLGIEFSGGAEFQVPSASCSIDQARGAVEELGVQPSTVTQLGNDSIRVTTAAVEQGTSIEVRRALAEACGVSTNEVSAQVVGPTWGGEITKKALTALVVFLALLSLFLAIYFDWRMAVAAIVALLHDIILTIGIYSLLQFEVTPSTVIGILTILGYSLYDTVVVFDKVKENTQGILGQSRQNYSQAANLAVNQTLVRSINTTIVALLPVGSILFVGAGVLGAGTLKDLSLALFVGMAAGAYSSIFIATPVLCQLMERQPQMQALARRVEARSAGLAAKAATGTGQPGGTTTAVATGDTDTPTEVVVDPAVDAMTRARARRAGGQGQRSQPKRTSRSKR